MIAKKAKSLCAHGGLVSLFALLGCMTVALAGEPIQTISGPSPNTPPNAAGGDSLLPVISKDGRFVLFASSANNLVLASNTVPYLPIYPGVQNVYLRDRTNGTTTLVSINLSGTGGGNADCFPVDISTNGQYALFESTASNIAGTSNFFNNLFIRDLVNGVTTLVTVNTNGVGGNGSSHSAVMTPDGRYVAFASGASDLVANDTNRVHLDTATMMTARGHSSSPETATMYWDASYEPRSRAGTDIGGDRVGSVGGGA